MHKQVVQPEGNYYDKYHSSNPIVKRMMKNFFGNIMEILNKYEIIPEKILEAGCGEGEITRFMMELYPEAFIEAFDISDKIIERVLQEKYDRIRFEVGDIYTMSAHAPYSKKEQIISGGGYELVVCSEVLEHLEYPKKALDMLKSRTSKYILLSVPNEPIWRILNMCRGKYLKQFGNTPGHIQHWNTNQFCKMLCSNGCEIVEIRKPLPWIMVLIKNDENNFTKE